MLRRTPAGVLTAFLLVALLASCGTLITTSAEPADRDRPFSYFWCGPELRPKFNLAGTPIRPEGAIMVYQHDFGKYPRFWRDSEIHGGVPQNADLAGHLSKLAVDMDKLVPDRNYNGFVIIDYEGWEPLWELASEESKEASRRLMRQRQPGRTAQEIERLAGASYNTGAKLFLQRTLQRCKELRPRARWGYYGMPAPYHQPHTERLQWLWDESTALFPEIYVVHQGKLGGRRDQGTAEPSEYRELTRLKIELAKNLARPGVPVIPIIWLRYHDMNKAFGGQFLSDSDLKTMVNLPREFGADGAVFWEAAIADKDLPGYHRYLVEKAFPALEAAADRQRP